MENYVIRWRGPMTWDEVRYDRGYGDEELYAIAHEPPSRSPRTLYVGTTYWQWVGSRLAPGRHQADADIEAKYGTSSIVYYLGDVRLRPGQRRSESRLRDIEAAIISFHSDDLEFNVQSTAAYYGRDLSIANKGSVPPMLQDLDTSDWE